VVVWGKPSFHPGRGTLALSVVEIRPLGAGALLARLEHLRGVLAAEGLFAASRKRRPPFLPRSVGLITGRASAAERDVVTGARRRWPAVAILLREVAVQGPLAVGQIIDALHDLDRIPAVDVIVIARGGGSMEDLLPFSDEALIRAVAAATTAVVSAIGHEQDAPLLDFVADVRASTPTDAAKRVVPDVAEQHALIATLRDRSRRAVENRLGHEEYRLTSLRSRPALAAPGQELGRHREQVDALRQRAQGRLLSVIEQAERDLAHTSARVRTLSPAAVLERGYALVHRTSDDCLVRDPAQLDAGDGLTIRVAGGSFPATVTAPPAPPTRPAPVPPAPIPPIPLG
jgi:exodeoxyribonuclease VII large subunit